MMFLTCPAYLDHDGAVRCGLPAEVRCRFTMRSTDGPIEGVMIRCPAGHCFSGAIESLTWDDTDKHDPGTAAVASPAGRDSLQRGHDDRHGGGGSAVRDFPAEPEWRRSPPEHRSRVLSGPPGRPVDHRHAPIYRRHVWVTPSGMFGLPHFEFIHRVIGADQIIWSVDYPFLTLDGTREFIEKLPVSEDDREKMAHLNAKKLFSL